MKDEPDTEINRRFLLPLLLDAKPGTHERQWAALVNLISDATNAAIMAGVDPKEVWLGPAECRVLEAEMNRNARPSMSAESLSRIISGNMEGAEILGFKVRCAKSNGVSVGTTFASPK